MFEFKGFLLAAAVTCFVIGNTVAQGGTVYKTVIKEGTGPIPRPNQTVVVHYTGTLENGVKIDSSYDRNEPFKFRLGAGEVIRGWDAGVSSMKVGERAKLEIAPEDGYGPDGMPGVIPPNATLMFDIELLAVEDTPGVQTAPFADIQAAAGGFQSFGTVSAPAQLPPTAFLSFPQELPPSQGMVQPAQRRREPNIQSLVASNSAFISDQPSSFSNQFSGVVPQQGQTIFGDAAFPTSGQNLRGTQATRSGVSSAVLQNGFGTNTQQVSFQQPQPQRPTQTATGTFFGQVPNNQGRTAQTFGSPAAQRPQFGLQTGMQGQGISQFMPQQGMSGTGTQQFNSRQPPTGAPAGFGVGREQQGFQVDQRRPDMSAPFRQGSMQQAGNGRAPPNGTPDRAAMQAMQERMLAARRMGLMPQPTGGRGFAGPMPGRGPVPMAEMVARTRMGMAGGRLPPDMRALMAMRAAMGPRLGPMPPGFPRPRISPFMARRMFSRRRLG